jgi:ubiquinone/menaquinone biosynthesis C-methylase UbiE
MNSSSDSVVAESTVGAQSAYEVWHERYPVDRAVDTPWHRLLQTHLSPSRDLEEKRVLEIGCGRGGFACWLSTQSARPEEIVAIDFAAAAIRKGQEYAAELGASNITWQVGDIQSIPHPEASFDTVFSSETIEHVPSPRRAIKELARVLKPGGRLLLTTPNYFGTMGLYRFYMRVTGRRFTEEGQPINNFMMLPLTRAWIAGAGLRVTAVDAVGHYLPFPGRPPIELSFLNNPRALMRWFGLHSLIVAEKS